MENFNEFDWISELPKNVKEGLVMGIGDDAAVIEFHKNCVISTDSLVEDSHFLKSDDPYLIGWKTAAVNLSDMAAMGCTADFILLNLHIPNWFGTTQSKTFKNGFLNCLEEHNTVLIGGDTVLTKGDLLHCVATVLGQPFFEKPIYRSGAKENDLIVVSGELGGSFPKRHLNFTPKLKLSKTICDQLSPTSMIDISDGVLQDLNHILCASKVGAKVDLYNIPIHSDVKNDKNPLKRALSDGEDFELLFTIPSNNDQLLSKFSDLCCIGEITSTSRELLGRKSASNEYLSLEAKGFQHNR